MVARDTTENQWQDPAHLVRVGSRDVRTIVCGSLRAVLNPSWVLAPTRPDTALRAHTLALCAAAVSNYFQLPPVGGEAASRSIQQPAADEGARRTDRTPYGSFLEQCMVDANLDNNDPFLPFNFRETKGKLALQSLAWQEAGLTTCQL